MNLRLYMLLLGLLLGVAESAGLCAAEREFLLPDEGIMARLAAGEPVLEKDTMDEGGAAASILILIKAPVEQIWAIITSCPDVRVFLAGLQSCEVLEDNGSYAVTHQVVDKGWTTPQLDYTFETRREPYRFMEFNLLSGNLKTLRGTWEFETLPNRIEEGGIEAGGVLVRHLLVLRPILPAPRWLVSRNLKKDLPEMMQCIRGLAQGSGSAPAQAADLAKCPGKLEGEPVETSTRK